MNLLAQTFALTKEQNRAALITFITAGLPNFDDSLSLIHALAENGADIIELGMPFSDPVADGKVIQKANLQALAGGQTLVKTLELVRIFRQTNQKTPIVLMGYFNPIHCYGVDKFVKDAANVGVNGVLVVDLPPEHYNDLYLQAKKSNLAGIYLVTPTTDPNRLKYILANSNGFIYYVAVAGITGGVSGDLAQIERSVSQIREQTNLPIAVGFGVKTPKQSGQIAQIADAVVVGSALVDLACDSEQDKILANVINLSANLAKSLVKT